MQEQQYAKWMAACKLGSKGKTLADASFDTEVKTIETFLAMQHRSAAPAINPSSFEITPQDFVAPRFLKKIKGKVSITHACVQLQITNTRPKSNQLKNVNLHCSSRKGFWRHMQT